MSGVYCSSVESCKAAVLRRSSCTGSIRSDQDSAHNQNMFMSLIVLDMSSSKLTKQGHAGQTSSCAGDRGSHAVLSPRLPCPTQRPRQLVAPAGAWWLEGLLPIVEWLSCELQKVFHVDTLGTRIADHHAEAACTRMKNSHYRSCAGRARRTHNRVAIRCRLSTAVPQSPHRQAVSKAELW